MNILEHPAIGEPTLQHILDALHIQSAEVSLFHAPLLTPEQFCPADAIASITQAKDWWPKDCPSNLSWAISFAGSLATYSSRTNTDTLLTHLGRAANRVAGWLQSEGRDPTQPNEDRAERMRRRNRERVAQYRADHRAAGPDTRPAAALAWDNVVELRRQRAAAIAEQDALVREAYVLMTDRAEDRKSLKADWDALVVAAEAEHRTLRG